MRPKPKLAVSLADVSVRVCRDVTLILDGVTERDDGAVVDLQPERRQVRRVGGRNVRVGVAEAAALRHFDRGGVAVAAEEGVVQPVARPLPVEGLVDAVAEEAYREPGEGGYVNFLTEGRGP